MSKSMTAPSLSFVLSLYRLKCSAELHNDLIRLVLLKTAYPQIFTKQFEDYISSVQKTAEELGKTQGCDFSDVFKPLD